MTYEKNNFASVSSPSSFSRYTVMSGTPEKILEHLLETIKLDSNGNDAIGGSPGASSSQRCFLVYWVTEKNWIQSVSSLGLLCRCLFPSCRALRQRLSSHPQSLHALQPAVPRATAPISCHDDDDDVNNDLVKQCLYLPNESAEMSHCGVCSKKRAWVELFNHQPPTRLSSQRAPIRKRPPTFSRQSKK